jgi:hypothetical protein
VGGGGGHHHGGGGHHGGWHGSRVVVGVGLPGYWYGGWPYYSSYYYPSYYAAPYPYYAPAAFESAPVYTEQAPQQASAPSYYYCAAAKGYYPYVRQCPEGWQRVPIAPARLGAPLRWPARAVANYITFPAHAGITASRASVGKHRAGSNASRHLNGGTMKVRINGIDTH